MTYLRPHTTLAFLAATLPAVACGGESSTAEATTEPLVRDSAGIRIVEHTQLPRTNALSLELVWEHGQGPGDYQFTSVAAGALLPNGEAIVADFGNAEVVTIASSGTSYTTLASKGRGPSEVMSPSAILAFGETTIWVGDRANRKLMRFEDGQIADTYPTSGDATLAPSTMPMGTDRMGNVLMVTSGFRTRGAVWIDGHVALFKPTEQTLDTVAALPLFLPWGEANQNPFAPSGFIVGSGEGFVHARTHVPELRWHDAEGTLKQISRWHHIPSYASEVDLENFLEQMEKSLVIANPNMGGPALQDFLDQQAARFAIDPTMPIPSFGRIHGTTAGDIWRSDFAPAERTSTRFKVTSKDGTWTGEALFPRPVEIRWITDRFVLVRIVDEMGVEGVAVYRYELG